MDSSELPSYVECSPFVEAYAVSSDGLDESLPASGVVDSSECVVVFDVFLRKHYTWLSRGDLVQLTGLEGDVVESCVDSFVDAGLVAVEGGEYRVEKGDERVKSLRDEQTSLLGLS